MPLSVGTSEQTNSVTIILVPKNATVVTWRFKVLITLLSRPGVVEHLASFVPTIFVAVIPATLIREDQNVIACLRW